MKLVNLITEKFEWYYKSFSELGPEHIKNFEIKHDHSYRVADLCKSLSAKLEWTDEEKDVAYICGLLHDIGRFQQLIDYGTFNDSQSVDHAAYSLEVLEKENFLDELTAEQSQMVLTAIKYHNKRQLPKDLNEEDRKYAKLLRDADKLDILKVITDYYTNPREVPNHTLTWEMPNGSAVSATVARQVKAQKQVAKEDVVNVLDIKAMQLSWVFDMNFKPSFQLLMEKRFLEKIYGTMPKSDTVIEIYRVIKVYAQNKLYS